MKYLIIFYLFFFNNLSSFSQTSSIHSCECLPINSEDRFNKSYKGKPCLLDFVKANIIDSTLVQYVGKKANYLLYDNEDCDEKKAMFIYGEDLEKISITILKDTFFMSEEKYDIDTIVFEELDFDYYKRVSIEGHPFVGIQYHTNLRKGVIKNQNIVSEIKIKWNDKNLSIPLKNYFLLFNTNFCTNDNRGLNKSIEIYDIGNNKLAIYFHGNPRYINNIHGSYIVKVIVDKNRGYVGTIFIEEYDLKVYGWLRCKDFQGF
jgi:hypothetical protein